MKFTSITQRFVMWFMLISLLPVMLIAYTLLHTFEAELQQTVSRHLSAIADKKSDQIDSYLTELVYVARINTEGNITRLAMRDFTREFARSGEKSAAYKRLDASYRDYFKRFLNTTGYHNLFLISPQGTVVYSQTHEADFATNLFSGPYRNSGLEKVTRSALSTLESGISEFEFYAPAGGAAAFIAVPVMREGKIAGVLVLQIDNRHVFEVLLDNTGLGESGETVVARREDGHSALLMAPLKFDADAALKQKISLDDKERGAPLRYALNGERGSGYAIDYNGHPVVAAWRYLPRMGWGMVTKIDAEEAFAPLYRVRSFALVALVLALAAALLGAVILGRRVIAPLQTLTLGAQQIAAGKLEQRIPVERADELGQLASSFNIMAENMQFSYQGLELQVNKRTAELTRNLESMRIKDAAIATSINAVAMAGLDGILFYVNKAFVDLWRLSGPQDAIGRSGLDLWERAETAQSVLEALQQEGRWQGELRVRLHDGSLADLQMSAHMVTDELGKPVCMMGSFVNISAHKVYEQRLQHSEAFLATLIDSMPIMVFVKRASDLCFEKFNHAGEKLLGFSEEELLGKNDFDFFPREQADSFAAKDRAVLASHQLSDIAQETIRTRTGENKVLHTRKVGIYNADGEATHLLGVSVDITERIQAEGILRKATERLCEAQRLAKVGSWELNLLTGVLLWSDEIYRLFEIDSALFGATYEAFLNAIHPDDRDSVNLAYTDSLRLRKPYAVKHRLLMADGRIKWVQELCESEFDTGGKPLFSRGTVQDITQEELAEAQLRESETRYHSVVSALSEGVVLNAKDGSIIAANEAAQEILGLTWEQMRGRTPIDPRWRSIHEDGTPFPGDQHPGSVTLRTGLPQSNVVMGVHKPDGRLTWILVNSQPIFLQGETLPSSVVASFVDISERKRAENILKNANEELERRVALRTALLNAAKEEAEQANNSKSVFLSSMSHELRTPLNAILGYAQLMQMDSSLPQRVVENAGEIKRAGDILLSLMNDILDLSRIESGKLQLEFATVSLPEVMKSCHSQNIQAANSRNVTLHMAASCDAYQVTADHRALMQVLNNLVSNAIKYNRDGGRVNVSCSADKGSMAAQGMVRISVLDTGLGIASAKQSKLFQTFNRLGAEMSNIEGTGIGLVISRKLVESMKGTIGVESVQGLGSTFWIELPLAKNMGAALVDTVAPGATEVGKAPQVLVVEDYAPSQHVLLLQLQTMGCEVDVAANGAEALKMWQQKSYDLILTDIDMPVMNGTEFAQAVRKAEADRGGRIPIIAITATILNSEMKRYRLAGIDEVLSKPLSMDALRNQIKRWLGDVVPAPSRPQAVGKMSEAGSVPAEHAILDLNYLYRILGQVDLAQARNLVNTFMHTAAEGLQALSWQTDNPAVVAKEMHKQKSSARTVGALHYASLAATLEQQTKDKHFSGIVSSLVALRQSLLEVEAAAADLLDTPRADMPEQTNNLVSVSCRSALVVDDDLVVLQQVKAILDALGVAEVITAVNGVEATRVLFERASEIEVLICDLSMPEMDGVELIRRFDETGFKGGLILISGADEKIINTVNKLAVLQGVRVLGQLQKPVSAAQIAILLAHTAALPVQARQAMTDPVVSSEAIRSAMVANEFTIWFQPKVDASSLRAVGMEALARWQLPGGKFIPPDSFIRVAENEGLIGELSRLLVVISLTEAAKLFAAGYPLKVAINLSGTWLNDLSLPDFILSNTIGLGLSAADVILEVTETGVMEDLTTALDVLSRLRLKGFGLSIDDFGIGYSLFEQLGRIPFTEMKLDRSFVSKGVEDAASRAILESSMDMAHKLDLATVAEGVETELDLKLVRSLGCDLVQGYLIAKPMPVKDLIVWLNDPKHKIENGQG